MRKRRRRTRVRWRSVVDLETHTEAHLSLEAVAEYLGLTRKTVVKFIQSGVLPAFRFGHAWRVRTADLRTYVEGSRYRVDG